MDNNNQKSQNFSWIPFYMEFADKLRNYRECRSELIEIIKSIYKATEINLPTLEKDGAVFDIDPFTVFGLFNKGIADENRIAIASGFKNALDIFSEVPADFNGIPILNNLSATFYGFIGDRKDNDIDNLWNIFISALDYAEKKTETAKADFCKWFDVVRTQFGVKWNLTMGLYWIRPYQYLSLDSRNRNFLTKSHNVSDNTRLLIIDNTKNIPTAENYLEICKHWNNKLQSGKYEYNDFPSFSYYVWISEKTNLEKIEENNDNSFSISENKHYWLYAPGENAFLWDEFYNEGIMGIGWDKVGDLKQFKNREHIMHTLQKLYQDSGKHYNDTLALWEFANEMKIGDIVICKKGRNQIVGCGIVISDYIFDQNRSQYKNIRKVNWTHKGEWEHNWHKIVTKTLTDITKYPDYVQKLKKILGLEETPAITEPKYPLYDKNDFLSDVFMSEKEYDKLNALLKRKKNIVLQGAPGVSKTFCSKRLAWSVMGEKNNDRVCIVQFHQSYSYEDFIMGYRPTDNGGFELENGVFYRFCETAKNDTDNEYFFIIDEINRGNLSKIFGELLMLIENDKRGSEQQINLVYGSEPFYIPENLYIIGMMNTADRSLAMIDYALRRRFSFYTMSPAFEKADENGFAGYIQKIECPLYHGIIAKIIELNRAIKEDTSLGKGFEIGHSYFISDNINDEWVKSAVEYEIIPLIEEYWFDNDSELSKWKEKLYLAIGEPYDE